MHKSKSNILYCRVRDDTCPMSERALLYCTAGCAARRAILYCRVRGETCHPVLQGGMRSCTAGWGDVLYCRVHILYSRVRWVAVLQGAHMLYCRVG